MTAPLSVLVIEDEPLIAMMIEDFIDLLGHELAGNCDSVADALKAKGIGFVVAIGGHVDPPPPAHANALQLAKPFTLDGVQQALEAVADDGIRRAS